MRRGGTLDKRRGCKVSQAVIGQLSTSPRYVAVLGLSGQIQFRDANSPSNVRVPALANLRGHAVRLTLHVGLVVH